MLFQHKNAKIALFGTFIKFLSPLSKKKKAKALLLDRGDIKNIKYLNTFKNGASVDLLAPDFQKKPLGKLGAKKSTFAPFLKY